MWNEIINFFSATEFLPHGHCFFWRTDILWLNVASDLTIALAYYSIPLFLLYFWKKAKTTHHPEIIFLFVAFIFACGTTHIIEVVTIWHGVYFTQGILKAVTAFFSILTAYVLWRLMPTLLNLQSQIVEDAKNSAKLKEVNDKLLKHLRENEEANARFNLIVEAFPNAIIMADNSGNITLVNAQAEKLFGYARDELLDKAVETLIPARFSANHPAHRQGYVAHPTTRAMGAGRDLFGLRKDGSEVAIEIGLTPLKMGDKSFVLATIIDITQRLLAAKQIQDYAADLKRSNEELEQFAYISSHDLQEPLRMVGSFAKLLGDKYKGQFDEQGEKWLFYLMDGANRMHCLVHDLLKYSRVGRLELNMISIDPNPLLDHVLFDLQRLIGECDAKVSKDSLPSVVADESQLRLVFQNLIANAIKFHKPNETPIVHIGSKAANGIVEFFVRDNGIGIDPLFFEKLFVIFQRLNSKSLYPGTGIGLAICKKIIERHDGRIWVESSEGQGSTFYFSLKSA